MLLVYVECFIFVTFQYMACGWFSECDSNNHECCSNYYRVNGVCTECPAGTFGVNCSSKCPTNYYGQFCKNECHCPNYQKCNLMNGCENISDDGGKLQCVQNYFYLNGNCTECPRGRFGINCTESCPDNYFGLFCRELCNCSADQYCDQVKGCQINNNECLNGTFGLNCLKSCPTNYYGHLCQTVCNCSTDQYCDMVTGCLQNESYPEENHTPTSKRTTAIKIKFTNPKQRSQTLHWKNISFALIGGILTALAATGVFCFRSRSKTIKVHWLFSHSAENHAVSDQDIEVANLENRSQSTHGSASEELREVFSSVYDDLRLSQMIDRNSASVRDIYHLAACSSETFHENTSDMRCLSKRQYIDFYTGANGEGDSANNYEHFQMPTEYSVLSLKRNIDPAVIELNGGHEKGTGDVYDLFVGHFQEIRESCDSSENSPSDTESDTSSKIHE